MKRACGVNSATNVVEQVLKEPKIIHEVREVLAGKGVEASGANLKAHLTPEQLSKLSNRFRQVVAQNEPKQMEYKALSSDAERRDVIAQFLLDPEEFLCKAKNSVEVVNTNNDEAVGEWLYETQVAGPMYLNDADLAREICGGLDKTPGMSRESDNPEARKLGKKQFYWVRQQDKHITGVSEKAKVEKETSISPDQFQEVANSMRVALKVAPKKVSTKVKVEKPVEAPEVLQQKAERKEALALRSTALRKLKMAAEKLRKDVGDAEVLIPKVEAKGYPKEMCTHFYTRLQAAKDMVASALARYGHEIIQVEASEVATINANRGELELTTSDLDGEMINIRKGAIADLRGLTGSSSK
jgi:hypothetical protein